MIKLKEAENHDRRTHARVNARHAKGACRTSGTHLEALPGCNLSCYTQPENPKTVLLKPVVDVDDRDEVMDVVIDRLGELQAQEQVSLLVVPTRPKARNEAIRRAMEQTEPTWSDRNFKV